MKLSQHAITPIKNDLEILNKNLTQLVGRRHPILYAAAEHLFNAGGKRLRPAIIFLAAKATNKTGSILASHRRLAEITEIIHTASLVHDDVIDECNFRRGVETIHTNYSTRVAVLAGDFLFAQSSWYLANLNNLEAVKVISKVIADFAEGEIRQGVTQFNPQFSINEYLEKSFYKTASLIAASCRGASMLSENTEIINQQLYEYGKNLGLAFQIIDDILDITSSIEDLGKPAGSDLKSGNLTAPILFALTQNSSLLEIIEREFSYSNDIKDSIEIIQQTKAIEQSTDLAFEHIQAAINSLNELSNSYAKECLINIANYSLQRTN
uniref:Prenyl transferase n=1 Tax=Sciadococcus taiwanensis TaxID=3028030 RepID=A0A9Y1MWR7_9RHOD|nr:prenyl transferase [Sciadococcus taiwanensis]